MYAGFRVSQWTFVSSMTHWSSSTVWSTVWTRHWNHLAIHRYWHACLAVRLPTRRSARTAHIGKKQASSLVKFMLMTLTHSIFYLLYFLRCISFFWFVYSSYFSAPLYLPWRGHYTNFWVADWLTFCRITRVTKIGFCAYCVMGTRWPLISGCHVMMKNNLLTVSLDQTIARLVPPKVFDISLIGVTTLKCVCGRPSGRHSGVCSRYSFAELYSDPNTYNAFVQPNVSGCALW